MSIAEQSSSAVAAESGFDAPLSLGQRLSAAQHNADNAAEQARMREAADAERRKSNETAQVEGFFQSARETFTRLILDNAPVKDMRIQLGQNGRFSPHEQHVKVHVLLDGYHAQDGLPLGLTKPRWAPLWANFERWAANNGLSATWEQEHDGIGMHEWWVLKVAPALEAASPQMLAHANDEPVEDGVSTDAALVSAGEVLANTRGKGRLDTFVSLDLEFNQPSGRLIQVGVTIASNNEPEAQWTTREWLLDPKEPISPQIQELTGITDDDIREGAVAWSTMARELHELLEDRAPFINPVTWGGGDAERLLDGMRENGITFHHFGRRWLDVKTMCALRTLAEGKSPAGGLRSVMASYGLQFVGKQHRAGADAFNTMRLFREVLERQKRLRAALELVKGV